MADKLSDAPVVKCHRCGDGRTVRDNIDPRDYPERMPCPACTDGTWADTAPLAAATPNTPEAPQEGLVEAARRVASAIQQVEHRNGPNGVIRVHLADAKALLTALTPSPVQSSPGEVERLREALMECELALPVLATMCGAAGLNAGKSRAIEILKDVRAALTPPSSPASAEVGK